MLHLENPTTNLRMVGEAISHELGAKMVKDFQDAHPTETIGNYIGRNVLDSILSQPGCVGIRFYNAINETGRKTLVYVGIDAEDRIISKYTYINNQGQLVCKEGIVADRSGGPAQTSSDPSSESSSDSWDWFS